MKIKKINFSNILIITLFIIIICLLKLTYIASLPSDLYCVFFKSLVIFWGSSQFVNLIWILPILISLFIVSYKYYIKFINFDTRFKNRRKFFNKTIFNLLVYSIICNLFILFSQFFIIGLFQKVEFEYSNVLVIFILKYILENIFIILLTILLSIIVNNYIYSYIIVIIIIISSLIIIEKNNFIPYISLYTNNDINYITVILIIFMIFILKKIYLKLDLGGVKNDFRDKKL